jgi:hypothetical protein
MTSETETETSTSVTLDTSDVAALPRVTKPGKFPIKSWVSDLEGIVLEQATNLSNLPFAIRHVALMPDAHAGYGMPIGGVLFADGAVVPYAIGVDIGCGVALGETDLTVETLSAAELAATLEAIAAGVPVGMSSQPTAVDRDAGLAEIGLDLPDSIQPGWFDRAVNQLGTLGSGNHFLELQRDEAGAVSVMLHSGSRSLGKTICDAFHKRALAENRRWHSKLPHDELAYLPVGTDGFVGYWAAMTFALRFAEVTGRGCSTSSSRPSARTRAPGGSSGSWTSTTTTRPGRTTSGRTGSCTARAQCALARARPFSSRARWAPRRTWPRASATPKRSRRASTGPVGR